MVLSEVGQRPVSDLSISTPPGAPTNKKKLSWSTLSGGYPNTTKFSKKKANSIVRKGCVVNGLLPQWFLFPPPLFFTLFFTPLGPPLFFLLLRYWSLFLLVPLLPSRQRVAVQSLVIARSGTHTQPLSLCLGVQWDQFFCAGG